MKPTPLPFVPDVDDRPATAALDEKRDRLTAEHRALGAEVRSGGPSMERAKLRQREIIMELERLQGQQAMAWRLGR
jgi:hypothetical protein